MPANIAKGSAHLNIRALNAWFEELSLPVAPACNMMCNFCSKNSDCICNGNSPDTLSKTMTPRQAVNWAISTTSKNSRIKVLRISGPGEPLCNNQTFEVLKRLNYELPQFLYALSTNGLLLDEKVRELSMLGVKMVDVAVNAVHTGTMAKLYPRLMRNKNIIVNSKELAEALLNSQISGMIGCLENGITVKVNTVCFPGINEEDVISIADLCKKLGVISMRLIAFYPGGKFARMPAPAINKMAELQREVSNIIRDVEIKSYTI